jgi:hypothetical protein
MGNDKSKAAKAPPAAKQPVVSKTVSQTATLKQTIGRLEQRRDFIEKKATAEHQSAVAKNKKGDKKGALVHLKRKKMYEKEIEKINGGIFNLEQQAMTIESTSVNVDIVNAMKTGKQALSQMQEAVDVDDVQDLQEDIAEQMAQANEIDDVISRPLGTDLDMDDLEDELAELESDEVAAQLDDLPSLPTSKVADPTVNLPAAPTHAVEMDDEDAALAQLEAEMAA